MASTGETFDEIEFILLRWLNALQVCEHYVKTLKDFNDGTIFHHLAKIIKDNNEVAPKSEEEKDENDGNNDAFIIAQRYDFVKSVLNDHFKLDSSKIINYEALIAGDHDETIKIAILLLITIVRIYLDHPTNRRNLNKLFQLTLNIQTFIQDCLEMILTMENEAQLYDTLSTVVEKRRAAQIRQPPMKSRRRTSSKESQLPPPSPLKTFIESADFRYKIALKDKKKEINYLKIRFHEECEKATEMTVINDSLQTALSEKDNKIKELEDQIGFLMPFRKLVESDDPKLSLQAKIAFFEESYKNCPTCIENLAAMKKVNEDNIKICAENENLVQKIDHLEKANSELKKTVENCENKVKNFENLKIAVQKYKFTSNLYEGKYKTIIDSPQTIENKSFADKATNTIEIKEETKVKIEKVSTKLTPDKNAAKMKEMQSTISELKAQARKNQKNEKEMRKEMDHITAQYGSSLEKLKAQQAELDDLKAAKSLGKEEECNETLIHDPSQKKNSTSRAIAAKRKKYADIQSQDEPVVDEPPILEKATDDRSKDIPHFKKKIVLMQKQNENLEREKEIARQQSEIERLESSTKQLLAELDAIKQDYQKLIVEKEMLEKDKEMKIVILKENYDQMRQEKEECDIKLQQLDGIRNDLLAEFDQSQQKVIEFENSNKEMIEQLAAREQEITSNKSFISELSERNSVLTNQFQEFTKCMNEKNKKIKELETTNHKLSSELKENCAKLDEVEKHSHQLSIDLEENRNKLNQSMEDKEECEQLSKKLHKVETEKQELSTEVERLTANINKVEVEKHTIMSELEQMKIKFKKSEEIRQQSLAEVEKITAKFSNLENDKSELLMKIEQLNSNKKKLTADITQLNTDFKKERNENRRLLEEIESVHPRISQLENDNSQLLSELQHLRENYKMSIEKTRKLAEMVQEKEAESSKHLMNLTKTQKELQTSENNLKSSERKYSECRKELEYTGEQLSELKKVRERQNRDIIKLEATKEGEINDLKGEKKQLVKMYEDLRKSSAAENEKYSNEIRILNIQLEQKEAAFNRYKELVEAKSAEIAMYLEEKKDYQRKYQDLEKALKLEKELADSDIKGLKDELEEKERCLNEKLDELKNIKEDLEQLRIAKEEELSQLRTANEEVVNETIKEKNQKEDEYDIFRSEVGKKHDEMQSLIIRLEQHCDETLEISNGYQAESKRLSEECNKLSESLEKLKTELQNKEKEANDIKSQHEQQKKDFEEKVEESKHLTEKIKKLVHEKTVVNNHLNELSESLTNMCNEKNNEISKIQQLLKEKEVELQEWKCKTKDYSVTKEKLNKLQYVEKRYNEAHDLNQRLKARIEELLNQLAKSESEKENEEREVYRLSEESRSLKRRVDTLKESNVEKSQRIVSLLTDINTQKESHDKYVSDMQELMEKETSDLQEKSEELRRVLAGNEELREDYELKQKEIRRLQKEIKIFKKIANDTKMWVHKFSLSKLQLSRLSKHLKIYKRLLTQTKEENKAFRKKLDNLIENSSEEEEEHTYSLSETLSFEVEARLGRGTINSLKLHIDKLEKFLDLERDKNKRLFMRLKATEYELCKVKRELDGPCVVMRKRSSKLIKQVIYREGCRHKTRDDDELSDGPPDPDMPGHQYMILRLLKDYYDDNDPSDPFGVKRKFPADFEGESSEDGLSPAEKRKKIFFESPSSVTYKLEKNVNNLPKDECTFRAAYSLEYLPASTNRFSQKALQYGYTICRKPKRKSMNGNNSLIEKAQKMTDSQPKPYYNPFSPKNNRVKNPVSPSKPKSFLRFLW